MPRPCRFREIAALPEFYSFAPEENCSGESIIMSLDEFETIRLLDNSLLTQEECAKMMKISRTTVTAVYESARRKIADCLLNGKRLVISGGKWHVCDKNVPVNLKHKGATIMRIAVTHENGNIFQHFGHTKEFKIYDIDDGKIVKSEVTDTNGQGHGALAGFLKNAQVDALICGGIGGGAQIALKEAGIKLYAGADGNTDDAVAAFMAGTLSYNPNATCNHHHGEEHEDCHGNGHIGSCGNHGENCGKHD